MASQAMSDPGLQSLLSAAWGGGWCRRLEGHQKRVPVSSNICLGRGLVT